MSQSFPNTRLFQKLRFTLYRKSSISKGFFDCRHICLFIVKPDGYTVVFRVCSKIWNTIDTFQDRTYPGSCSGSDTPGNRQLYRPFPCQQKLRSCENKYRSQNKYEYDLFLFQDKSPPWVLFAFAIIPCSFLRGWTARWTARPVSTESWPSRKLIRAKAG